MTPSSFAPSLFIFAHLLALALHSNGSLITQRSKDSLVLLNASVNAIQSHCYTPDRADTPGIQPTDLQACQNALAILVHMPDFITKFRYSRNRRSMGRKLPLGWQLGDDAECRIVVNCQNDRDSAMISYAEIAQAAKRIMDNCVDKPDTHGRYPVLKWGGVSGVGEVEDFYVAVARPIDFPLEGGTGNWTDVFADDAVIDGGIEIS